ncbi:DUF2076 domain-containing protein [Benzoatithermus flavus]|uniref:DUF2076 domain-containing protein n=1 Tax=Benzoatithermus flavus TaxID=3108223 RepID=A0ABU8XT49_9PROT
MDQRERQAIDGLFAKLRQLELQSPQRDAEADQYIRQQVASLPAAPYYMAQAILVQEQALATLQARVQELERQLAERPSAGGGFLSGLFGGGQPAQQRRPAAPPPSPYPAQQAYAPPPVMGAGYGSPWGRPAGGGFFAGAMQTALGVAGGMLVADAIANAFEHAAEGTAGLAHEVGFGSAEHIADTGPADESGYDEPGFVDAGDDEPGYDDTGDDFGGGDETI